MDNKENIYKELYFGLYAKVSDIIEELQDIQRQYEELYSKSAETSAE